MYGQCYSTYTSSFIIVSLSWLEVLWSASMQIEILAYCFVSEVLGWLSNSYPQLSLLLKVNRALSDSCTQITDKHNYTIILSSLLLANFAKKFPVLPVVWFPQQRRLPRRVVQCRMEFHDHKTTYMIILQ